MRMPLPLTRLVVVTLAATGFACLLTPQPSLADPSQTIIAPSYDPQNNVLDPFNTNNTNPFSSNDSSGLGMFDLIHRAKFGMPSIDLQEQNQQLNDAAATFKARQQQLIQQSQQRPGFRTTTPQVITPQ